MKRFVVILLLVMFVFVVGCTTGNKNVSNGYVVDWISNVEYINQTMVHVFWVRYDTTSAYCTVDSALARRVQEYADGVTVVRLNYTGLWADGLDDACDYHKGNNTGSPKYGEDVTVYRLVGIEVR